MISYTFKIFLKGLANLASFKWFPYRLTSVKIIWPWMSGLRQGKSLKGEGRDVTKSKYKILVHSMTEEHFQWCWNKTKDGVLEEPISEMVYL